MTIAADDLLTLRLAIRAELARRKAGDPTPGNWEDWLKLMFPQSIAFGFADHHREFWDWVWSIQPGIRPRPFVAIWPRGGGKTTGAELAVTALGLRGIRSYCLYVRSTQDKADESVTNIAARLESAAVARYYPAHADRLVSKYGHSRGWRRNRLRTAGGFTVDGIGLDVAARGAKIDDRRPDLIVFDDIDELTDSVQATQKKASTITKTLIPAGSDSCAILVVQNLIIPNGIVARLADGRADFLSDRIVSGPHPAIIGLKYEPYVDEETGRIRYRITAGTPTWEGQNLARCEEMLADMGPAAFLQECQHQVYEREGALWTPDTIPHRDTAPPLKKVVVAVDPSGGGDEIGIVAAGLGYDGRGYVLADRSQPGRLGPYHWGSVAVDLYDDLEADEIVAERNFGGDMVAATIQATAPGRRIPVTLVSASRGKALRADPVAALYERGLVDHVGSFPELEAEMTGWVPGDPNSPNRLDALVWALTRLMLQPATKRKRTIAPSSFSYSSVR